MDSIAWRRALDMDRSSASHRSTVSLVRHAQAGGGSDDKHMTPEFTKESNLLHNSVRSAEVSPVEKNRVVRSVNTCTKACTNGVRTAAQVAVDFEETNSYMRKQLDTTDWDSSGGSLPTPFT